VSAALAVVGDPEPLVFDIDHVSLMDMIDIESEFGLSFTEMKQGHLMAALAWLEARKSEPGVHWEDVARRTPMSRIKLAGGDDDDPKDSTTTAPRS
jgi:hypothetical protein